MAEGTAEEDMCIKVAWATTLKLSILVSEQMAEDTAEEDMCV